MKQQGKSWVNAAGESTLAKYLPKHEVLFEKLAQKIAAEATYIEQRMREARAMFIDACKEALRNSPDKNIKSRFSFYSFDREFKIEFDIKEEYVRTYRATKNNPTSKDYELMVLDFNKAEINKIVSEVFDGMDKVDDAVIEDMQEEVENSMLKMEASPDMNGEAMPLVSTTEYVTEEAIPGPSEEEEEVVNEPEPDYNGRTPAEEREEMHRIQRELK